MNDAPTLSEVIAALSVYSAEWNERAYGECLSQVSSALLAGELGVVDATFPSDNRRSQFIQAAIGLGVPVNWLTCDAQPATVQTRLDARQNDVSDASWQIYQQFVAMWESPGPMTRRVLVPIIAELPPAAMVQQARTSIYRFVSDLA